MKLWQHDETGRFTEAPESPGPRWNQIPYHCASCQGTGSGGMGVGCTDCLGTGLDPKNPMNPVEMNDAEIERLAADFIAEDWTPDRYYRNMNLISFANKLLEYGYAEGRKDEREQILSDLRAAREKLDDAIARCPL